MALTKEFTDTVRARATRDPAFRRALLREAIESLVSGDIDTGKIILRDYINATLGFERLATLTGIHAKSLMRMFGPTGNPLARHLLAVIVQVQRLEGVSIQVALKRKGHRAA